MGLAFTVLALALGTSAALAQNAPLPERFATTERDTDRPGGDLTALFDVTLAQCHATCVRRGDCAGFTFNERHGACFLKATLGDRVPYVGAVSGVITTRPVTETERAREALAEMGFIEPYDLDAARELAASMAERYQADGRSEADLLATARAQSPTDAVGTTGAAVTVADSGAAWLAHARALLAVAAADPDRGYEPRDLAAMAALHAALRLPAPERAEALVALATAWEANYRGEGALAALRLADTLRPGVAPDALARVRERFGFRVLSHDVDAATAAPRICVAFSETLSATRDYASFVAVPHGLALEVEGSQLCVTGVAYGERYRVTLRAGLPDASGDALARDVPLDVYVRDRAPSVRFPGRGYVLPAAGPRALPIETVNADALELRLLRVSDRNLVAAIREGRFAQALNAWEGERFESLLAESVWEGSVRLAGTLNQATTSRLPLDAVGPLDPGVYVLRATVPGTDPWEVPAATQWFLVSDLGVTTLAGNDGLHVVAQRLSDGGPADGLLVTLVARSNRVLGEARTDAQGHVRFAAGLTRGSGAAAPALVLVEGDGDLAVLSLEEAEFDLSDRGVTGRVAPGPLDVFLTTDRGVYRPGETIHVTALARDGSAQAVADVPLTARLLRPDGVEHARVVSRGDPAGGHVVALRIGADVPRGVWRVEVRAEPDAPPVASRTVLVEDFVPERIDFTVTLRDDGPVDPTAPTALLVEARYLFGPPASGLTLTGGVTVSASDTLPGWHGYRFGRADEHVDAQLRPFDGRAQTDAAGQLEAALPLERLALANRPYVLTVLATLADGGARPVERRLTRALRPAGTVVGIRPGFDGDLPEDAEATFDLVLVDEGGRAATGTLRWQVDRVLTRYQWFSQDGRWSWEPITWRERVAEGVARVDGGPARIAVPVTWGRHDLRVTAEGDANASSSLAFSAGWYAVATARETPELLDVALDAAIYAPGDVARLRIVPDGAGVAVVAVLTDRVVDLRLVAVDGETVVELPVTAAWGVGAYVTASLIRTSDAAEYLPQRSIGLAHATVAPGDRVLDAALLAPAELRSREQLEVTIELPDAPDGPAYATVAAVDLGALTLTGFAPPDPIAYFFGQRRLGVAIRDLYGRLIDASEGPLGRLRSGGDEEGDDVARAGPIPAEDVVALFSGPVTVVAGRATVAFDVPAFSGTLRVMAVAWTGRAVGQAHADVLVRDPVVVRSSLPRFMTPGDASRLRLELTHVSGAAGAMRLEARGHGLGDLPASLTLRDGERAVLDVPLRPTEVGDHTYTVTLTTPSGDVITRELRLTVLHTDPPVARSTQVVLAPGETFRLGADAVAGFRPGSARATLAAGAGAALDVPGLIVRLLAYPYGCTEQIASSLQPLLLAPLSVTALGLATEAEVRSLLQEGVDRVLSRQGRTGGFGLWGTGGGDLWLDAYVTDVLVRAEARGAVVPATALRMALDNLRNRVARAGSLHDGAAPYAYAFYVLARAGEASIGDLRYYADTLPTRFDTPLSAAHLAAALAAVGERSRSDALFARARDLALARTGATGWRDDYGTALRDAAGLLALAVEAGTGVVDRRQLAGLLTRRAPVHQLSSQEAAWLLHAATALAAEGRGLVVDGRPVTGDALLRYEGVPAVLRNAGTDDVTVTLTTYGVPEVAPEAGGVGYSISREHFTMDGARTDLDGVRVGDRLVVVLEVRPDRGMTGGRLLVDDALPAGFEIDNPNLLRAGDVRALDWLAATGEAAATEARVERFLAAVDWTSAEPLRLAYVVRAVSAGEFHYAAAAVEDMYRPTNRAVSATGRVIVRP